MVACSGSIEGEPGSDPPREEERVTPPETPPAEQPEPEQPEPTSPPPGFTWKNDVTLPTLENPTVLTLPDAAELYAIAAWDGVCAGDRYELTLENDQDYVLLMGDAALAYPIAIHGGRNVRIIGLAIDLVPQPGCDTGEVDQPENQGGKNIHPLMPGGIAVRLEQVAATIVEGAFIKLNGTEGDCFVGRNAGESRDSAIAFARRDYYFVNSRCEGIEGVNDYLHGDIFQQQGPGEVTRKLIFENFTGLSAHEGVIHEANDPAHLYGIKEFVARRFNYIWDPVYGRDDYDDIEWGAWGPPAIPAVALEDVTLDDYYVMPFSGLEADVSFAINWGTGDAWDYQFYAIGEIPGMHFGDAEFAPAAEVGLTYVSPFPRNW